MGAVLVAAALLAGGCIPADNTGAWQIYPGDIQPRTPAGGATPGLLVLGDSLIASAGPNNTSAALTFATTFREQTLLATTVAASGGTSFSHWVTPSLITKAGLNTVDNYVRFFKPRITVLALGTNDARILTTDKNYLQSDFEQSAGTAIMQSLAVSRCVVLTTVTTHTGPLWQPFPFLAKANAVNAYLRGRPRDRIFIADWEAASAGHVDWFQPDQIHPVYGVGTNAYRNTVLGAVRSALASGKC